LLTAWGNGKRFFAEGPRRIRTTIDAMEKVSVFVPTNRDCDATRK
jgi:hypothetical protein